MTGAEPREANGAREFFPPLARLYYYWGKENRSLSGDFVIQRFVISKFHFTLPQKKKKGVLGSEIIKYRKGRASMV